MAAAGIREVLEGRVPEFTYEYGRPGMSGPRWFRLTVTQIDAAEGSGAVVMHVDITEQRQTEDHLRKLSMAVEQSPVSIIITDCRYTGEGPGAGSGNILAKASPGC